MQDSRMWNGIRLLFRSLISCEKVSTCQFASGFQGRDSSEKLQEESSLRKDYLDLWEQRQLQFSRDATSFEPMMSSQHWMWFELQRQFEGLETFKPCRHS